MAKQTAPFVTEADLCSAFIAWAQGQGWVAYPEWADFDILLAHPDGTQIGVQAKLRFNLAVLQQIVPCRWGSDKTGPDFLAVLVPECGADRLCEALGITPFVYQRHNRGFAPNLESYPSYHHGWHFTNYAKRCPLPRFVPDVIAGASAPTKLTEWKISALAIAAALELRGYVTRDDFRHERIDHRRWVQDWLVADEMRGYWKRGPRTPDFAAQHPTVYPQVRAEVAERLALKTDPLV